MPRRDASSPQIRQRAKELRQEMTPAERWLWEHIRNRRLGGFKFRRQHPVGQFVADFYCAEVRLILELDGGVHDEQQERDAVRSRDLQARGYRVLRLRNERILRRRRPYWGGF